MISGNHFKWSAVISLLVLVAGVSFARKQSDDFDAKSEKYKNDTGYELIDAREDGKLEMAKAAKNLESTNDVKSAGDYKLGGDKPATNDNAYKLAGSEKPTDTEK